MTAYYPPEHPAGSFRRSMLQSAHRIEMLLGAFARTKRYPTKSRVRGRAVLPDIFHIKHSTFSVENQPKIENILFLHTPKQSGDEMRRRFGFSAATMPSLRSPRCSQYSEPCFSVLCLACYNYRQRSAVRDVPTRMLTPRDPSSVSASHTPPRPASR